MRRSVRYLVDLTYWGYEDITHEITVNGAFVMAFGLRKDNYHRNEQLFLGDMEYGLCLTRRIN